MPVICLLFSVTLNAGESEKERNDRVSCKVIFAPDGDRFKIKVQTDTVSMRSRNSYTLAPGFSKRIKLRHPKYYQSPYGSLEISVNQDSGQIRVVSDFHSLADPRINLKQTNLLNSNQLVNRAVMFSAQVPFGLPEGLDKILRNFQNYAGKSFGFRTLMYESSLTRLSAELPEGEPWTVVDIDTFFERARDVEWVSPTKTTLLELGKSLDSQKPIQIAYMHSQVNGYPQVEILVLVDDKPGEDYPFAFSFTAVRAKCAVEMQHNDLIRVGPRIGNFRQSGEVDRFETKLADAMDEETNILLDMFPISPRSAEE